MCTANRQHSCSGYVQSSVAVQKPPFVRPIHQKRTMHTFTLMPKVKGGICAAITFFTAIIRHPMFGYAHSSIGLHKTSVCASNTPNTHCTHSKARVNRQWPILCHKHHVYGEQTTFLLRVRTEYRGCAETSLCSPNTPKTHYAPFYPHYNSERRNLYRNNLHFGENKTFFVWLRSQ